MPIDLRRPVWIGFILICVVAGLYSWFYFAEAFPILDLTIRMDRTGALKKAHKRAKKYDLGPRNFQQAASFHHDVDVQTFVELEAGGKKAFRNMIQEGLYEPYQWHVRHYAPGKTRETMIRFTPEGEPYGFKEKWPEDAEGPSLTSAKARSIAERKAQKKWDVKLSNYKYLSASSKKLPSGRIDHTFTYERRKQSIGKGEYRLRLRVSGDQLSEVTHYVKIPEAFSRRYKNMRSANSLIQNIGTFFVYIVYLLIGCLFGAYWLLRRNSLRWKKAVVWGGLLTLLLFLSRMNALPLSWMNYDTAMAPVGFIAEQVVGSLSSSLLFGAIITLSFISAEGLTREAFGHHPKLWKLWNPEAASSKTVSSLTLFGYLLLGPYFAYNVALYSFAQESLGWWTPSNLLYDPNILAHYVTWLKPVVNSLQAGFWEECLFRAVPLAGAALIGNHLGKRNWWIGVTLVLQALVFGAGHASYATQPSYARVVELFFSSLGLGLIYLGYGLLPVIISHYLYDLVLMAMPIFVATSPGILLSQIFVVLFGSFPLLVVLLSRIYVGEWRSLEENFFNRHKSESAVTSDETQGYPIPIGLSQWRTIILALVGLVGGVVWFGYSTFQTYEKPLSLTRLEAKNEARSLLENKGVDSSEWISATSLNQELGDDDAFIWQVGGDTVYRELMGSYLKGPYWTVRFMKFSGSVKERAEEYKARLAPSQNFEEIQHYLPESTEGDSLTEAEARVLADSAVIANYGLNPRDLERISADPQPRPARRDWTFTYGVPDEYPLSKGEARISVTMLGSEVTDTSRYVHVPETWQRRNRNRKKILDLIGNSSKIILYLFMLGGAFLAIVYWGRDESFSWETSLILFSAFLLLFLSKTVNSWPSIVAGFNTAEPYLNQVMMAILGRIQLIVWAVILSLVGGYTHAQIGPNKSVSLWRSGLSGFSLGLIAVGIMRFAGYVSPDLLPEWGSYSALNTFQPWIYQSLRSLTTLLMGTVILLLFSCIYYWISNAGSKQGIASVSFAGLFGLVIAGNLEFTSLTEFFVQTMLMVLLFIAASVFVIPYDRSFLPAGVAGLVVVDQVEILLTTSHPYGPLGSVIAIFFSLSVALVWIYYLQKYQVADTRNEV